MGFQWEHAAMKKIVLMLTAVFMLLALTGCGGEKKAEKKEAATAAKQTGTVTKKAEAAPAPATENKKILVAYFP